MYPSFKIWENLPVSKMSVQIFRNVRGHMCTPSWRTLYALREERPQSVSFLRVGFVSEMTVIYLKVITWVFCRLCEMGESSSKFVAGELFSQPPFFFLRFSKSCIKLVAIINEPIFYFVLLSLLASVSVTDTSPSNCRFCWSIHFYIRSQLTFPHSYSHLT